MTHVITNHSDKIESIQFMYKFVTKVKKEVIE